MGEQIPFMYLCTLDKYIHLIASYDLIKLYDLLFAEKQMGFLYVSYS